MTTRDEMIDNDTGVLKFTFQYHQKKYREIKNSKAYSSETLLGQVGGFVGIWF